MSTDLLLCNSELSFLNLAFIFILSSYIFVILECLYIVMLIYIKHGRYIQRFDPGFGFSGGPYGIQPMYAPAVNYNTEFPQLGSAHRPVISTEHPSHQLPQHLPGPWATPSTPGIGYVPTETMIPPFGPNHVVMHSNSALYLHSAQYPRQHPGMPFIHHHEQVQGHPPFSQVCHIIVLRTKFFTQYTG